MITRQSSVIRWELAWAWLLKTIVTSPRMLVFVLCLLRVLTALDSIRNLLALVVLIGWLVCLGWCFKILKLNLDLINWTWLNTNDLIDDRMIARNRWKHTQGQFILTRFHKFRIVLIETIRWFAPPFVRLSVNVTKLEIYLLLLACLLDLIDLTFRVTNNKIKLIDYSKVRAKRSVCLIFVN